MDQRHTGVAAADYFKHCRTAQGLILSQAQFPDQAVAGIGYVEVTVGIEDHAVRTLEYTRKVIEFEIENLNAIAAKF